MQKSLTRFLAISGLLAISTSVFAKIEAPKTLTFAAQEYKVAKKINDNKKDVILTEYLLPGEKLKNFTQIFAIWEKPQSTDIKAMVAQVAQEGTFNGTEHRISSMVYDKENNEYIIAKILTNGKTSEYNVYRLFMHDGHLAAYAYTQRTTLTPKKDNEAFNNWVSGIKDNERSLLTTLMNFKLP